MGMFLSKIEGWWKDICQMRLRNYICFDVGWVSELNRNHTLDELIKVFNIHRAKSMKISEDIGESDLTEWSYLKKADSDTYYETVCPYLEKRSHGSYNCLKEDRKNWVQLCAHISWIKSKRASDFFDTLVDIYGFRDVL